MAVDLGGSIASATSGPDGQTPYDEVVYPTFVHDYLHPDRIASIAWLRGLDIAPATDCRYVELGCGDGATLLALAIAHPNSRFVGVDLAPTVVERGRREIEAVGVSNLELLVGDLADPTLADRIEALPLVDGRPFDHVVSHGVYSWVPDSARQGLLTTAARLLAPHGSLYLSYNAYPGGFLRELTRGILTFHVKDRDVRLAPDAEMSEAIGIMRLLADAREGDLWGRVISAELSMLDNRSPASLRHDELGEINDQFWLHEMADAMASHGFTLLGEADDLGDLRVQWSEQVADMLEPFWDQPVVREQYIDLLFGRRFRRTLWSRTDAAPTWPWRLGRFDGMLVGSSAHFDDLPDDGLDLAAGVPATLIGGRADATTLTIDGTLAKAALAAMISARPEHLPFTKVVTEARRLAAATGNPTGRTVVDDAAALEHLLISLHPTQVISLRNTQPTYPLWPSERPVVSPLIRRQLETHCTAVATLSARVLEIDDDQTAEFLLACDGTRTVAELVEMTGAGDVEPFLLRLAAMGAFIS